MKEESSGSGTSVSDGTKRNQTLAEGEKAEVAKSGNNNTPRKKQTSGNKRQNGAGSNTNGG